MAALRAHHGSIVPRAAGIRRAGIRPPRKPGESGRVAPAGVNFEQLVSSLAKCAMRARSSASGVEWYRCSPRRRARDRVHRPARHRRQSATRRLVTAPRPLAGRGVAGRQAACALPFIAPAAATGGRSPDAVGRMAYQDRGRRASRPSRSWFGRVREQSVASGRPWPNPARRA
jgi:hypothetical protein